MTHSTLDFLLKNNITIIQTVFAIIFLLVVFVIVKSFKEEKAESVDDSDNHAKSKSIEKDDPLPSDPTPDPDDESMGPVAETSNPDAPMDDLDNLDELMAMEQASEAVGGAAPGASAAASAELTQALTEKEKVIGDLKSEIASLQEKMKTQGDSTALEGKVKELSDKLSEYEIIEDDIANLSFYKNENIKLKNELDKLKGLSGAAPAAPVAEPPPPEAPPAPKVPDESVLTEFEQAVKQKEAIEQNEIPSPVPISTSSENDILKEFETVVDKELGGAPAAPPPSAAPVGEDINSKKLVEEMEALAVAPPPPSDDDDGKDNNQKLIEEFENFVNKG